MCSFQKNVYSIGSVQGKVYRNTSQFNGENHGKTTSEFLFNQSLKTSTVIEKYPKFSIIHNLSIIHNPIDIRLSIIHNPIK